MSSSPTYTTNAFDVSGGGSGSNLYADGGAGSPVPGNGKAPAHSKRRENFARGSAMVDRGDLYATNGALKFANVVRTKMQARSTRGGMSGCTTVTIIDYSDEGMAARTLEEFTESMLNGANRSQLRNQDANLVSLLTEIEGREQILGTLERSHQMELNQIDAACTRLAERGASFSQIDVEIMKRHFDPSAVYASDEVYQASLGQAKESARISMEAAFEKERFQILKGGNFGSLEDWVVNVYHGSFQLLASLLTSPDEIFTSSALNLVLEPTTRQAWAREMPPAFDQVSHILNRVKSLRNGATVRYAHGVLEVMEKGIKGKFGAATTYLQAHYETFVNAKYVLQKAPLEFHELRHILRYLPSDEPAIGQIILPYWGLAYESVSITHVEELRKKLLYSWVPSNGVTVETSGNTVIVNAAIASRGRGAGASRGMRGRGARGGGRGGGRDDSGGARQIAQPAQELAHIKCHHCGEFGHYKSSCPQLDAELAELRALKRARENPGGGTPAAQAATAGDQSASQRPHIAPRYTETGRLRL